MIHINIKLKCKVIDYKLLDYEVHFNTKKKRKPVEAV